MRWLLAWPLAGGVEHPEVTLAALVLCGTIFAGRPLVTGVDHSHLATPQRAVAG